MSGRLILCATPIGNLGDVPQRLGDELESADVLYAEDTRRARRLLDHLGIRVPVRSYFVGNEDRRAPELAARLESGDVVALLTDAGTPGVADPGLTAVRAAVEAGATVSGVPGPSAVTLALAVSGAPADRFVFEGFLPRSGTARRQRVSSIATDSRTTVFFAAPSRLVSDLTDLASSIPERPCVIAREMTKLYEEVWRGTLGEAVEHWSSRAIKGEVTVVVFGGSESGPDLDVAIGLVRRAIEQGERPSAAVRNVAEATGVRRSELYAAVIEGDGG